MNGSVSPDKKIMMMFVRKIWLCFGIALFLGRLVTAEKQLPDPDIFDGSLAEVIPGSSEGGQGGEEESVTDESENALENTSGDAPINGVEREENSGGLEERPGTENTHEENGKTGSLNSSQSGNDDSEHNDEDGKAGGALPQGATGSPGTAPSGGIDFGDLPEVQEVVIGGGRQIDRPVQPEPPELPPGALPEYSGRESAGRTDQGDGSDEIPGNSSPSEQDAASQPVENEGQDNGSSGSQPTQNEPVRPVGRGDSVPTDF